jgi:hypothetical protein
MHRSWTVYVALKEGRPLPLLVVLLFGGLPYA